MTARRLPKGLAGRRWVHAHEEDTAGTRVFRPATVPLPPARGRYAFELRADGGLVERPLARDDAPRDREATWRLEEDGSISILDVDGTTPVRRVRIVALTRDRLIVEA